VEGNCGRRSNLFVSSHARASSRSCCLSFCKLFIFLGSMYSDVHKWWAKQNLVTFFVNLCVLVVLPKEGSGRVWRPEEVPAFPPEPSPTIRTLCCQHALVYKKVTRFCLARHLWTSLYSTVKSNCIFLQDVPILVCQPKMVGRAHKSKKIWPKDPCPEVNR